MDLDDYPNIRWDRSGRLLATREIYTPGRDRRATTFLKGLEALDNMKARVFRVGINFRWEVDNLHGSFALGADGEWSVEV